MMKKTQSILLLIILYGNLVYSQSEISTDPSNPINTERPELTNHFNWEGRTYPVYHPDGHFIDGNNAIHLGNPYYKREFYQRHFNLYDYETTLTEEQEKQALNFHPKDGWELLYKNNGIDPFGNKIIDPLINRIGPYFAFYNKYTGILRVIASFDGLGANDKIQTTLKLKEISGLDVSALLNFYGATAQPLDQKTDVIEIAQVSGYASNRGFVSADFQMSYDPCNCNKKSELESSFSLVNNADLKLSGRLIATEVPLDASGNSPLLNRQDFLTAVYKDGFNVKGGALTYSNIDKLVEKYKGPITNPIDKLAIDIFKSALSGGASAIDKSVIGPNAAIVFNAVFKDFPNYKNQESVGLGIVAAGAKALSAMLFPENKVPNISFIEGEMALSGTLTDYTPLNNGSNIFVVPGSLNSQTASWQYYPLYNKPLGLFALLETPTVIRSTFSETIDGRIEPIGNYRDERTSFRYMFKTNIKYTFNPSSGINIDKTKVYGALVITGKNPLGLELIKNLQKAPVYDNEIGSVYITPFLPVEYLSKIIPQKAYSIKRTWEDCTYAQCGTWSENIDVKLRVMIEFEFYENSYNKINKSLQIYTYPVNIIDGVEANINFQDIGTMQIDYATTGDLINPQPYYATIGAWNKIEISHTVGAMQPNGGITFKANQIVVKPGAVLKRGITLKSGLPYEDRQKILPVNSNELNSFCINNYQAYLSASSSSSPLKNCKTSNIDTVNTNNTYSEKPIVNKVNPPLTQKNEELVIYPNPNNGSFTVLNTQGFQKIFVNNINGVLIYSSSINEGENILQLSIGQYVNSGVIIVKLVGVNNVVVKKIIIK